MLQTSTLEKVCSICSESKPLSKFSGTRCRTCRTTLQRERMQNDPVYAKNNRDAAKKWHKDNPKGSFAIYRRAHLKHNYGILQEDYDCLFSEQNGVCAICKEPEHWTYKSGKVAFLAVDHDHTTGKVRGLLCRDCNQSIGKFKDDYKLLYSAYEYLAIHQMKEDL